MARSCGNGQEYVAVMANNACKDAVRKRSQRELEILGEATWIKPSAQTKRFMDQKRAPGEKPKALARKK
jgi:hypothetical protein